MSVVATLAGPFVFEAMGTVVSISAGQLPDAVTREILDAFDVLEERFSLYIDGSEASAVARRELPVSKASDAYRRVYDDAIDWRTLTDGAFTPHRPDGVIDLSGIVKSLAIADAARVLDAHGVTDYLINAGGDVLSKGLRPDGGPWVVGVVDPQDRSRLLTQYVAPAGYSAVATSGVAERGEHVWRVGAGETFCQVTVVADDIVTADVLATAILSGGPDTMRLAQRRWDIEVFAASYDGRLWASPCFRSEPTDEPDDLPTPASSTHGDGPTDPNEGLAA